MHHILALSFFPAVVYDSTMESLSGYCKDLELTNLHFVPMINAAACNIVWWMHTCQKLLSKLATYRHIKVTRRYRKPRATIAQVSQVLLKHVPCMHGQIYTYIKSIRGFFLYLYVPHKLVMNFCFKIQVNLSQVYNVLYLILPSVSKKLSRKLYLFPDPDENLMVMHDPDETHKSSF